MPRAAPKIRRQPHANQDLDLDRAGALHRRGFGWPVSHVDVLHPPAPGNALGLRSRPHRHSHRCIEWDLRGDGAGAGGTHVVIAARNLTAAETMRQAATSQPTSLTGAYRSTSSFRELNGARLEASVRAYGGAGQRKVSNKCQRAERGEAGGVSEGVRWRRPEEGVQQMVRMLPPPAVRELNGARLEASVRAYGGAGQRKVSNKWLGCYLRPRIEPYNCG
ncbi:uncharacterized protein LOC119358068 [Triticum dicoccoides]|uniref:uncharacterized protein LOC119358068 n=1 Tax=Triticum dicoccoides TaxID=85692 RepID=UPI00188F2450|nr:uncharacterized protein LOC119358068 [Triticum dicoccoides]